MGGANTGIKGGVWASPAPTIFDNEVPRIIPEKALNHLNTSVYQCIGNI